MSTLKTNQLTHLSNTGTANVIMASDGDITLADDLTVGDNLTVNNTATITGAATLASTATITGNLTCNGSNVTLSGSSINLTGTATIAMGSGGTSYSIGTNGEGNRTVSTGAASGGSDGDIHYQVA